MSRTQGDAATGSGGKRGRNGRLVLWAALDLLLIGASIVLVVGAWSEGFWWKRATATAADGGGSTIPIPPPDRPTPQISNGTPAETPTPTGVLIDLTLADLGLRILPEDSSLAEQQVVFPFPLDPESGITWQAAPAPGEGGVLTIPLTTGQFPGDLMVELGHLQANGQEAIAPVLGLKLAIGPVDIKRTGSQPRTVGLSAELQRVPTRIVIEVRGVLPDSRIVAAVNEAAVMVEMGVVAIAYAAKIDTNLADEITSAIIEMAVDKGWAEAWPRDRVLVARIGEDGKGRILETTPLSEDASGLARFRAESEEGFSTFVLTALGEMTTREAGAGPSLALWFGFGLGAVGLVGLATGAFILMSSQRRRSGA